MEDLTIYTGFEKDVYLRLIKHIEDRLKEYPANGTREEKYKFYSDLDDSYQQEWIVNALLDYLWHHKLILTGAFGELLAKMIKEKDLKFDYILFNGHLRDGAKPEVMEVRSIGRNVWDEGYLLGWWLIDDSYYSGRTKMIIEKEMRDRYEDSYHVTNTVVIYNGCSRWTPHVNSMYSWYMVHGLETIEYNIKHLSEFI